MTSISDWSTGCATIIGACSSVGARLGETTLAQAIAEYLTPTVGHGQDDGGARTCNSADRITQYAPLEGDLEKTAEIIFLFAGLRYFR